MKFYFCRLPVTNGGANQVRKILVSLIAVMTILTLYRRADALAASGTAVTALAAVVPAFSIELRGVEFRAGQPGVGEDLAFSAKPPSDIAFQLLEIDAETLGKTPSLNIRVVGFTDDRECSGRECDALSLRRAKCVYDWLIEHHVPQSRLKGPEGRGSQLPIDDNETEEGRQRNRRVELIPELS